MYYQFYKVEYETEGNHLNKFLKTMETKYLNSPIFSLWSTSLKYLSQQAFWGSTLDNDGDNIFLSANIILKSKTKRTLETKRVKSPERNFYTEPNKYNKNFKLVYNSNEDEFSVSLFEIIGDRIIETAENEELSIGFCVKNPLNSKNLAVFVETPEKEVKEFSNDEEALLYYKIKYDF